MIDEVFDKPIETKYEKLLNVNINNVDKHDIYRFKTNNGFSYDVEFYKELIGFKYIKLLDGTTLPDKNNDSVTMGIIIGFTPTEINYSDVPEDVIGTLEDPYISRTGRNEQYEVLGKIIFLVDEYIKNNPDFYVYIITKNTNKTNIRIYNMMFKNIFLNNFNVYESDEAFYYIKK